MANERKRVEAKRATSGGRGSSLYGASVEYALHSLLWLTSGASPKASARDLADVQRLPAASLAKLMPRLEKAGIVRSSDGVTGGYELAKTPAQISMLDVVDALEPDKRLFDCKDVRRGCVLFGRTPPAWSVSGVCRIHAVMLRAEQKMRLDLAKTSLADLVRGGRPTEFESRVATWFHDRGLAREQRRLGGMRAARRRTLPPPRR